MLAGRLASAPGPARPPSQQCRVRIGRWTEGGPIHAHPLIPQGPQSDACSLLTAKEVSGILGIKSLPGRPWLGTSKTVCFFSADTTFELTSRTATVQIVTAEAFNFGKQMSTQGPLAGRSAGVGDESYYVSGGSYAKLDVRRPAAHSVLR